MSNIILNYGIEIECSYDLMDDIKDFIETSQFNQNMDILVSHQPNIDNLKILLNYLKEVSYFTSIITKSNSNFKIFIKELFNKIYKYEYYNENINDLLLLLFSNNCYFEEDLNNNIMDLSSNIIILDDINDFLPSYNNDLSYKLKPELDDNKIHLIRVNDCSVLCDFKYNYTDLTSDIVSNKYYINENEFITEVFKNTNDVNRKLSILYDKVKNRFINCISTSQHVHISFNNSSNVIRPNNNHIVFITILCYIIQKDIFKYVLSFRNKNDYCRELNIKDKKYKKVKINKNDTNTNQILKILLTVFYNLKNKENIRECRYYWLNLINLFIIDDNSRPPTLEFRIKHGSNDSLELSNFCKLYEIIIKKGIELSDEFFKTHKSDEYRIEDVIKFINLYFFNKIFPSREISKEKSLSLSKSKYININYIQILLNDNRSLLNYFNNLNKKIKILDYVLDNNISKSKTHLKPIIQIPSSLKGGLSYIQPPQTEISNINDYAFYKLTSFGYSFIGYGLDERIIKKIKLSNKNLNKELLSKYGIIYKKSSFKF